MAEALDVGERERGCAPALEHDPAVAGDRAQAVEHDVGERGDVQRRQRERHALVGGGEREEVVDGAAQAIDLLAGAQEHLAGGRRVVVVAQAHVELGPHRGQRGAELVGGVGHQAALLLHPVLDAVEHRVERPGQVGHLVVRARLGHAIGQPLGADRLR